MDQAGEALTGLSEGAHGFKHLQEFGAGPGKRHVMLAAGPGGPQSYRPCTDFRVPAGSLCVLAGSPPPYTLLFGSLWIVLWITNFMFTWCRIPPAKP